MHHRIILPLTLLGFTLACQWGSISLVNDSEAVPVVETPTPAAALVVDPTQTAPPTVPPKPTTIAATAIPSPTPVEPAMPIPTPPTQLVEFYTVQAGDTLSGISFEYDIGLDELIALNKLNPESAIIQVGQTLNVPLRVERRGPVIPLLPDSEVVYSPAYQDFDVAKFITEQGGYLATYTEPVNGVELSAAEIINRAARQFSIGPRVFLAFIEYYGGWVTQPNPTELRVPLGPATPYGENLFLQLSWTANRLNEGYYDYKRSGSIAVRFRSGRRAVVPYGLNAGTAAIQNALAVHTSWDSWQKEIQPDGFMQTYRDLFGDPAAFTIEPLVPQSLTQPPMQLPWERGQTFYFTGGPHAAYGSGSAWAAVDFGPPDVLGSCFYSNENITAVADGQLILGRPGEFYLDMDGDGNLQTGWVVLYLHAVALDSVSSGQMVKAGTPLGVASCEGGRSTSSHIHLARRYNGEWLDAAGPIPMVLSGWQIVGAVGEYNGEIVRDGITKTACECWGDDNAIVGE